MPSPGVAGAPEAPAPAGRRARRIAEHNARRRPKSVLRVCAGVVLRIVMLAAGLLILWPANWGGFTGLTVVQGNSMEPTYETGDLVVTLRQPSYGTGDVISYVVPDGQDGAGGRVIHRIHAVEDGSGVAVFTTQGDNNPEPDIWEITAGDVTGKAILHVPGVGHLLGGQTYALLIGAAAGLIVLVFLWPGGKKNTVQRSAATTEPVGEPGAGTGQ